MITFHFVELEFLVALGTSFPLLFISSQFLVGIKSPQIEMPFVTVNNIGIYDAPSNERWDGFLHNHIMHVGPKAGFNHR